MEAAKKILGWISQVSLLYKIINILNVGAAAAGTVWVFVMSTAGDRPLEEVVTISVLVFGGLLLCINQFKMLMQIPVITRAAIDLRYGLAYEGMFFAFNPDPKSGALQLGLVLANSTSEPIRFAVERFDVVIGTTTLPAQSKSFVNMGTVIPVGGKRTFRDTALPYSVIGTLVGAQHQGHLETHIAYGRAGDPFERRYKLKLQITVGLVSQVGVADLIIEEADESI